MGKFVGICLILIGAFFAGLTIDNIGKLGNVLIRFIAMLVVFLGAKIIINQNSKYK